jgi:hypothetical protein
VLFHPFASPVQDSKRTRKYQTSQLFPTFGWQNPLFLEDFLGMTAEEWDELRPWAEREAPWT